MLALTLTMGAVSACGERALDGPGGREGQRIAVVDGQEILASEVQSWAAAHRVDVDVALEALVDEALLVAEAQRRGLSFSLRVQRRAMAQVILDEIEDLVDPASISMDEVRAEYDATLERMARTDPNVVVPPFDNSVDEIRVMLAGRKRFAQLEALLSSAGSATVSDERVEALLQIPAID